MTKPEMRELIVHLPAQLAEEIDRLGNRLGRSRDWIVEQALTTWIAQDVERDRLTHEALAQVDAGTVIDQETVEALAEARARGVRI